MQTYVERPLLIENLKFDLRLYVLVKSFVPLEAYLHAEGFARVATTPYTTDASALGDEFVHLTNSSIQMRNLEAGGGGTPAKPQSVGELGSRRSAPSPSAKKMHTPQVASTPAPAPPLLSLSSGRCFFFF